VIALKDAVLQRSVKPADPDTVQDPNDGVTLPKPGAVDPAKVELPKVTVFVVGVWHSITTMMNGGTGITLRRYVPALVVAQWPCPFVCHSAPPAEEPTMPHSTVANNNTTAFEHLNMLHPIGRTRSLGVACELQ